MGNPVREYYDQDPFLEWNRLFATPYRQLEYEVVLNFLTKFLPPRGTLLDAGGGPGRYAIALAKMGYRVTLVDLSEANIQFAQSKIHSSGLSDQFDGCYVADARALNSEETSSFDAVLCMGPLYHLLEKEERIQCLLECNRVMKSGAPIFVTWLPRLSYIRDALRSGTSMSLNQALRQVMQDLFQQGYSVHSQVPQTYFGRPEELDDLLNQTGFEPKVIASCHGCVSFMDDPVNEASDHAETWNAIVQLVLSTCNDPAALSMAEHIIGIGKKNT